MTIVRHTLGDFVTVLVLSLATVVFGVVIALYQCWQLALVVLGCIPLVLASTMLSKQGGSLDFAIEQPLTYFSASPSKTESDEVKLASTLAASSVQNARSVTSLALFDALHHEFSVTLFRIVNAQRASLLKISIFSGFAQFVSMAIWALAFWFAGQMIELDECTVPGVFSVCFEWAFLQVPH